MRTNILGQACFVFKKDASRIDISVRAALNGFFCGVRQAPGQPAPRVWSRYSPTEEKLASEHQRGPYQPLDGADVGRGPPRAVGHLGAGRAMGRAQTGRFAHQMFRPRRQLVELPLEV